ncbi:GerAB/ArcD/ProY family transporter [Aneurinibacillus sp. REN35]|uniref:GerAB/ArcD/ProY family transporter n=2 Tax=Paenibacillaceae TaxID=186822 RepID=UPI0035272EAE
MYEKGRISAGQLFILMLMYLTATSSNTNYDFIYGGQDGAIANLIAIPLGIFTMYLLFQLQRRHPEKTLFEYAEAILGTWLGKLITLLYILFTLEVAVVFARGFGEFIVSVLTPELSPNVYVMGMVLVAAYAVYRGLEAFARFAQVAFPFYFILLVFINFLLVGKFQLEQILPLWDRPAGEILFTSYLQYVFPIGEVVFFIGIIPYVKRGKNTAKWAYSAIAVSGLYLAYRVLVSIGVLGLGAAQSSNYPYIAAMRFVKIGEFVERIDILFLGIYIMIILLEFIVIFYTLSHGVAHLTGVKSVSPLVIPLCFLIVGLSGGVIQASLDFNLYITHIRTITSPIFVLIIPLLLLLVSRIRFGRMKKEAAEEQMNGIVDEKASN